MHAVAKLFVVAAVVCAAPVAAIELNASVTRGLVDTVTVSATQGCAVAFYAEPNLDNPLVAHVPLALDGGLGTFCTDLVSQDCVEFEGPVVKPLIAASPFSPWVTTYDIETRIWRLVDSALCVPAGVAVSAMPPECPDGQSCLK